jgi:ATP-dependent Clp protease ATP-binding subunit ClpA
VRGYDPTFGARPMARLIQDQVKRPLANEMLFGSLREGGRAELDVANDELLITYVPAKTPKTEPAEPV